MLLGEEALGNDLAVGEQNRVQGSRLAHYIILGLWSFCTVAKESLITVWTNFGRKSYSCVCSVNLYTQCTKFILELLNDETQIGLNHPETISIAFGKLFRD